MEGYSGSDGSPVVVLTYAGPDTGGGELLVPSAGSQAAASPPPYPLPPSAWGLTVYSYPSDFHCMPVRGGGGRGCGG